jgi:SAM-dependent methyltransferase
VSYAGRHKYDEPGKAAEYAQRSRKRDEEEWALLERALATLPETPSTCLDVPCGTGRIAELMIQRGIPTACADLSPAMRSQADSRLQGRAGFLGVHALDLESPGPEAPARHDLVVCFRFLHHLPDPASRARVWQTLADLTGQYLLVSFHHPVSAHNLSRALRRLVTRRKGDRHTLGLGRVRKEARAADLEVEAFFPLGAWRRELWLALLRPRTAPA